MKCMCGEFSIFTASCENWFFVVPHVCQKVTKTRWQKNKWTQGWTFLLSEEFTDIIIQFIFQQHRVSYADVSHSVLELDADVTHRF